MIILLNLKVLCDTLLQSYYFVQSLHTFMMKKHIKCLPLCVPNALVQNVQVCVGGWVCSYTVSVCVSEHASLRHQFSRHVAQPSRRWETCGKQQLWRVKTFFMDDFLWHSWGTGEKGWEANEVWERRGRQRWRGKFSWDKRRRKVEGKDSRGDKRFGVSLGGDQEEE